MTVTVSAAGTGGDPGDFNTFAGNARVFVVSNGVEQPPLRADLSESPSLTLPFGGHFDPPSSVVVELTAGASCLIDGSAGATGSVTWTATPD